MINYLSIDLESWAYPNLPEYLTLSSEKRKKLDNGNVKDSILLTLKILKKYQQKITFFVVAELYEWYPKTIELIEKEGHEIAFHTYAHELLSSKKILEMSLQKSSIFLKKFKPIGFRAPRINLTKDYFPILKRYGFRYDSSIYGSYESRFNSAGVTELPVSKYYKVPLGSGYFIGLFGKYIGKFIKQLNQSNIPFITFLHNWQILSPINPSFPTKKYLITHPYYFPYLRNAADTFEYLLKKFIFSPMKNLLE